MDLGGLREGPQRWAAALAAATGLVAILGPGGGAAGAGPPEPLRPGGGALKVLPSRTIRWAASSFCSEQTQIAVQWLQIQLAVSLMQF